MKLAVHCANLSYAGGPEALAATLAGVARAADEGGVTTLTMMDHWFQMEDLGGPAEPMLEGYTSLGFLAGQHRASPARPPGHRSHLPAPRAAGEGGHHARRAVLRPALLGLGAAWYEREHRALGVPFPPVAERFERLEETIRICRQMWSDDDGPFEGEHYRLAETICTPSPVQAGGPPLLVGGGR